MVTSSAHHNCMNDESRSPTNDRLDQVQARHSAWYSCDDETPADYTGEDFGATWNDNLDFVEAYELNRDNPRRKRAMAHEMVREDIPWLIQRIQELESGLT